MATYPRVPDWQIKKALFKSFQQYWLWPIPVEEKKQWSVQFKLCNSAWDAVNAHLDINDYKRYFFMQIKINSFYHLEKIKKNLLTRVEAKAFG